MQQRSPVPANPVLSVRTTDNISCLRAIHLNNNSSMKTVWGKKIKPEQKNTELAGAACNCDTMTMFEAQVGAVTEAISAP